VLLAHTFNIAMSAEELARVKLITLLNVASGRNGVKRKTGQDWHEIARQAKKSKPQAVTTAGKQKTDEAAQDIVTNGTAVAEDDEDNEGGTQAVFAKRPSLAEFSLVLQTMIKETSSSSTLQQKLRCFQKKR
jgi:hypothetical protein